MWEMEDSKGIGKQAQQAEMAGSLASKPTRIKRGKEWVNRPMKPKEWSNKPMRIIKGKKEVNKLGKPGKWISKLIGLT